MPIHNNYVTIAKAIGIILMVVGHSNCPIWLENLIYLFHMPLFFFCSGMFFKHQRTMGDVQIYINKRIKGLYLPFIKYSFLFLFLHNFFMYIGLYNRYYGYLGGTSYYGFEDFVIKAFYILFTMHDYEDLLGGFWFIRTLFVSSLLISGVSIVFKKEWHYRTFLFCVLFFIITFFVKRYCPRTELYRDISLGALGALFYLFGYYYQQFVCLKDNKIVLVLCSLILLALDFYYDDGITMNCTYNHVIPYLLTGVSGTILILYISKVIEKRLLLISRCLYYIGNHTLIILALHFLCFKVVSYIITVLYSMDYTHIAEHPVINNLEDTGVLWWVFYTLIGVVLPLVFSRILEGLKMYYSRWA